MKLRLHVAGALLCTLLVTTQTNAWIPGVPENTGLREQISASGELNIAVADYADDRPAEHSYSLQTQKGLIHLRHFDGRDIAAGSTVLVTGSLDGMALSVTSATVLADATRSGSTPLLGDRTVGVFYVDFNDSGLTTAQMAEAEGAMYTDIYYPYFFLGDFTLFNEATVKSSLEKYSHGQVSINEDADGDGEFDIFGPFGIDFSSTSCPSNNIALSWANAVDALATAQGIDLSLYQHKVYILPGNACGFRGYGQINCGDTCRAWSTLATPVHTITHELGHNFGLRHVGRDWNDDGIFSADETDSFNLMGGGAGYGDPMAPQHVQALGWLDAFPDAFLNITGSGTYTIRDTGNLGAQPVAIRLQASVGPAVHNFYFSYHQSRLAEFDVLLNYFDPLAQIGDSVRIFRDSNTPGHDSVFLHQIDPGASYLHDVSASGLPLGLWVEASASNGVTTELSIFVGDTDGDAVFDYEDNCYLVANPTQYDADCDGFGNLCDGDFNNDNVVNYLDVAVFSENFASTNGVTDLNGDGSTNFIDYGMLTGMFLAAPGPAGPASACTAP